MAGLNVDLNKDISLGKKSRGKMPYKTSINLVVKKESFLSSKKAIPSIIAGVLVLALLIGLLVVMPVIRLTRANARVAELQTRLDEANDTIKEMGYIEEEYAHYTTEGMTAEELSRVDRAKVMKLVEDASVNTGTIKGWNLTENIMSLEVSGASLSELNQIAAALEKQEIVDRCVINSANKGQGTDTGGVAVSFVVYLNDAGTAQTDAAAADDKKTEEGQEQ